MALRIKVKRFGGWADGWRVERLGWQMDGEWRYLVGGWKMDRPDGWMDGG